MRTLLKIGLVLRDIVEIYVPVTSFVVMFLAFLIQIFYRYVLNDPLTWPFEVTTITFLWTVLLGAIYARRTNQHVVFSLLFDLFPEKVQVAFRFIANAILFVAFGIGLYPAYDYIQFMVLQRSPALQIPFNYIYFPYLIFSVFIMGYSLYDMIGDFRRLKQVHSVEPRTRHQGGEKPE